MKNSVSFLVKNTKKLNIFHIDRIIFQNLQPQTVGHPV